MEEEVIAQNTGFKEVRSEPTANGAALVRACETLLTAYDDFWVLAGLTDCSYEEGVRNAAFKRTVNRSETAGLVEPWLTKLRLGINGNLQDILQKQNPAIEIVTRTVGKGQDLSWNQWGPNPSSKVEVKQVYDCTVDKYYSSVAADFTKLELVRRQGFSGELFVVVFFTQFPALDYPASYWKENSKRTEPRKSYLRHVGIDRQWKALDVFLGANACKQLGPLRRHELGSLSPQVKDVVVRRAGPEFVTRDGSWAIDLQSWLEDAEIAFAIWRI